MSENNKQIIFFKFILLKQVQTIPDLKSLKCLCTDILVSLKVSGSEAADNNLISRKPCQSEEWVGGKKDMSMERLPIYWVPLRIQAQSQELYIHLLI